jgi:quercetin dioxygenase-like cupin family protein
MDNFPEFMRHPSNRVVTASQHTTGIEGYVYDGADGGQIAIWICHEDAASAAHTHDFDEYIVVIQGEYSVLLDEESIRLSTGDEVTVPKGVRHGGLVSAGKRIVNAFGGHRAERAGTP